MIGALDEFTTIFGAVPDGGITWNAKVAKAMIRSGLAVVLIQPNGKKPVCTFTTAQAQKADRAAQDAAKDKGSPNWSRVKHECGIYHALTEEKELSRARVRELLGSGCNLAVAPGASRTKVVIVDVDTEVEKSAWLQDIAAPGDSDPAQQMKLNPPTVTSPGSKLIGPDGQAVWVHKDGGHYWYRLPEGIEPPAGTGKYRAPGGWVAYYGSGYVLVPPSVRPEGPYRLTGSITDAPEMLVEVITAVHTPAMRMAREDIGDDDPIDVWAASTAWEELLVPRGFVPHDYDQCGCPTYTRPGSPAHAKSLTAHDPGCTRWDTPLGHGPAHLWSDELAANGNGSRTMSKLTFVAWNDHHGDMAAAMADLDLAPLGPAAPHLDELDDDPPPKAAAPKVAGLPGDGEADQEPDELDTLDDTPVPETAPDELDTWADVDLGPLLDEDLVPLEPDLMPRTDGVGLLYSGKLHSFHGESESGKSLIVLWEAARLMNEGHDVVWIDLDSDAAENVGRLLAFGVDRAVIRKHFRYIRPETGITGSTAFLGLFKRTCALAVIDGVTDAVALLSIGEPNRGDPNDAYTKFSRRLPRRLADMTGAAVVMIDHVTKDPGTRGRFAIGAQAKMSQLTGAAYTVAITQAIGRGMRGEITLMIAKDRPSGIRPHAGPMNGSRLQEVARIVVDSTLKNGGGQSRTALTIQPQGASSAMTLDPFGDDPRPQEDMDAITQALTAGSGPMGVRQLREALRESGVSMSRERFTTALEWLERDGTISAPPAVNGRPRPFSLIQSLEPGSE